MPTKFQNPKTGGRPFLVDAETGERVIPLGEKPKKKAKKKTKKGKSDEG